MQARIPVGRGNQSEGEESESFVGDEFQNPLVFTSQDSSLIQSI